MFYPLSSFYVRKKDDDDDGCIDRIKEWFWSSPHDVFEFFFVYILHTKNDDLHLHLQTRKWWPGSKCILCILIRSFVCVNERKSVWWIPSENVNVYNSHCTWCVMMIGNFNIIFFRVEFTFRNLSFSVWMNEMNKWIIIKLNVQIIPSANNNNRN